MIFFFNLNNLNAEGWRKYWAWLGLGLLILFGVVISFFIFSAIIRTFQTGLGGGTVGGVDVGGTHYGGITESTGRSGFCCVLPCFPLPLMLFGGGIPFLDKLQGDDKKWAWPLIIAGIVAIPIALAILWWLVSALR
ncbi:MAG: hypothetical protein FWD41_00555 [Actinomycetia bacterium]|nr:hypothetical protein [Actinomycetes bacterium]